MQVVSIACRNDNESNTGDDIKYQVQNPKELVRVSSFRKTAFVLLAHKYTTPDPSERLSQLHELPRVCIALVVPGRAFVGIFNRKF